MNDKHIATDEEREKAFRLLFLMFRDILNTAKCELPENDIRQYASGLAIKIFRQICSMKLLMDGSPIPYEDKAQGNYDFASIDCVGRSIIETYLIYHWIFVASTWEEEQEFKYFAWILGSLLDRQKNYPMETYRNLQELDVKEEVPDVPKALENDKREIEKIRKLLLANKFYVQEIGKLPTSDQRRQRYDAMTRDGWYPSGWQHLQKGVPAFDRKNVHQVLSHAVHSGYTLIRQITHARTGEDQRLLANFAFSLTLMVMARLSYEYVDVFPHAAAAFDRHLEGRILADVLRKQEA